ncbi:alcohol dehydrogenase catalytic domain-containing protein [Salinicola peritrichatus]|uniref:alcohol dehydrogenase catalytic domain-containing protein n=1 Tax=Salinicola peritrichatus TaxID=1267424 RepID=UPI003B833466
MIIGGLQAGEVLVRVHAVGLNPSDWYLREGYRSLPPEWQPQVDFPLILRTDVSGVVAAVADDVEDFFVGDEVYSMVRSRRYVRGKQGLRRVRQRAGVGSRAQTCRHRSRTCRRRADVAAHRVAVHGRTGSR